LNTDRGKLESSQKDESRVQSDNSPEAYKKPAAFNCCWPPKLRWPVVMWRSGYGLAVKVTCYKHNGSPHRVKSIAYACYTFVGINGLF